MLLDILYTELDILYNELDTSQTLIEDLHDYVDEVTEKIAVLETEDAVYKLMRNPMHNNNTSHLPNTPNRIECTLS